MKLSNIKLNMLTKLSLYTFVIFGLFFSLNSVSADILLTKNLNQGDIDPEVMVLQKILNSNGYTIANSGPGSSGQETERFGALTTKAVKKFQCANNIVCDGYENMAGYGTAGPATRAKLNSLIAGGTTTGLPTDGQVLEATTGPTFTAKANAELDALVSGIGRGQFYVYENNSNTLGGALKPNSNSWTSKLDFTGVMTWQSEWGDARKPGTLITPQFMIQANHYKLPIGTKVRFSDKTGAVEERTITDSRFITGTDQQIVKLDRPLPTDRFKVYKLLNFSDANSLIAIDPVRNYDKPAVLVSSTLAKFPINDNLKILSLNQDRAVMIGVLAQNQVFGRPTKLDGLVDLTDVNKFHNIDSKYVNPNFSGIRDGDSSSPMFIVYNNELVLVSAFSFSDRGDFYSYYKDKINSTIAEMGSTDRVGIVSASGFVRENSMPLFTIESKDKNLQVSEKSAVGTIIGKVTANDIDSSVGQTITYSIIGGSGKDYFDINNNGEIYVKNSTGLDLSSATLKTLAGITSGTVSSLKLKLFVKAQDNGSPAKADYLYDDNIMKDFSAVEVEVKAQTPSQVTSITPPDTTSPGASSNPKTISMTSPITRSQIGATTPLNFSYQVTNWPTASVNVVLIPYNADGIEIRGGVNSLTNGDLTGVPLSTYGRTGSATYNQLISQATIDLFDTRSRTLGATMAGGLKLPIKYKVKICGSGTDSTLCAISNESFTLVATPPTVTPPTDPVIVTNTNTPKNTDTDGDGKSDEVDYCPNTPSYLKSSVNTYGCIKPQVTTFDIVPNLERNLNSVKSVVVGRTGLGRITFIDDVALTRNGTALDLDNNLKFTPKKVELNSTNLPELNKSATITLYNITETNPKIMRNGVECKAPACIINSYSGGTLVFTVTGFSTYEVVEGAVPSQTPTTYLFGVNKSGTGSGTVSGTGISCGIDCTEVLNSGATMILTATPSTGSVFTGWSTGCSGTGTCSVIVNGNINVNAVFDLVQTAAVVTNGGGGGGSTTGGGGGSITSGGGAIVYNNQNQSTTVSCTVGEVFSSVTGQRCTTNSGVVTNQTPTQAQAINQVNNSTTYARNLTIGSRGTDVTALQNFLISKNLLATDNNTGYFGPATRAALASWQASVGISPAEGYFGAVTRARLGSGQTQSNTPTYTPPTQAQNQTGASTTFTRNLTIGSRGSDVTALQNLLIAKGFLSSDNNTGYFGQATKAALARWQANVGISPAEGYFGAISRAAMK